MKESISKPEASQEVFEGSFDSLDKDRALEALGFALRSYSESLDTNMREHGELLPDQEAKKTIDALTRRLENLGVAEEEIQSFRDSIFDEASFVEHAGALREREAHDRAEEAVMSRIFRHLLPSEKRELQEKMEETFSSAKEWLADKGINFDELYREEISKINAASSKPRLRK